MSEPFTNMWDRDLGWTSTENTESTYSRRMNAQNIQYHIVPDRESVTTSDRRPTTRWQKMWSDPPKRNGPHQRYLLQKRTDLRDFASITGNATPES